MNQLMKSGQVVRLTVLEEQGSRYILTNGDVEIPLNTSDVLEPLTIGDLSESLFIYRSSRRLTSNNSCYHHITEADYGWARVLKVTREGAYCDIGTSREVLVSAEDLPVLEEVWPQAGDHLIYDITYRP